MVSVEKATAVTVRRRESLQKSSAIRWTKSPSTHRFGKFIDFNGATVYKKSRMTLCAKILETVIIDVPDLQHGWCNTCEIHFK